MRLSVACVFVLLALSGCSSKSSAPASPPPGNSAPESSAIQVTPSTSQTIVARQGTTQALTLTFTAPGTTPLYDLTATLTGMPADWTGPTSFQCAVLDVSHSCVLNLSYSPLAAGSGTYTLRYDYTYGASRRAANGTIAFDYLATSNNNVAAAAPSGPIYARLGNGTRSVAITFTTDDSNPATALAVTTAASALPAGWSGLSSGFTCAVVSTGNGCQLVLTYTPTAVASGGFTLSYGYSDNSGIAKTGSVNLVYAATSTNNVVGTASPAGQVNAIVAAGAQSVDLNFTTDDANVARAFSITSDLTALPAGWSSTASAFTCATVSTGSACLLPLTYSPTVVGSGVLTIAFAYSDNSGDPKTGTVNLNYASTSHNNVAATAAPSGQINAVLGTGTHAVTVTFTTDDGNAATALAVSTDLTALPAGWSSTANNFTCASVSTGNGCQLPLSFAPGAVGSGTLTLAYSYSDNSGAAKTGTIDLAYASTSQNNIVAAATPSGQINAVVGAGTQAVAVNFTTDDGNTATALTLTTDLGALPAGWSSTANNFTCASVSTGNGCQLPLSYAPGTVGSGTLALAYSYTDNSGAAKTGTVNVPYASTINNNVVATAAPSGQINAVVGAGTQAVNVTFTTDDGNPAASLAVTTDLAALPSGWSSTASTFTCASVSTGNGCQLPLSFAPSAAGTGNVVVQFSYTSNSGVAKTGSVTIPFASTANNNVAGSVTPSGQINGIVGPGSQSVVVVFATDDGNPASGLTVTTDLSALPDGWSHATGSFACASVSGTSCALTLAFTSYAVSSGTLSLAFGYTNNAGIAKTGTVNINYASIEQHIYIPDLTQHLRVCSLEYDDTLGTCVDNMAGTGFGTPSGIAFAGNHAFVSDYSNELVWKCDVNAASGALTGCVSTGSGFSLPMSLDVKDGWLYVASGASGNGVSSCAIAVDGTLSGCTMTAGTGFQALEISGDHLYLGSGNVVQVCSVAVPGPPTGCVATGSTFTAVWGLGIGGGYAYVGNQSAGGYTACVVNPTDGTLSACSYQGLGSQTIDVAIRGSRAYVDTWSGTQYACDVGGGTLSNCGVSNGGVTMGLTMQMAIH